jgi:RHS repeat-associated protein
MTVSMTRATDPELLRDPVTDTYDYDAFGNPVTTSGSTPNTMLYLGEQFDPDLWHYYLRARYYNFVTGRFVSRDPEDGDDTTPATLHKYLYAHGDPVNARDPSGRAELVEVPLDFGQAVKDALVATLVTAGTVCILNEAAELIQGLYTDLGAPIKSITFGFCAAKVRKGCTCTAKCTCHAIGMPDHGNTGFFVTGSGTANSCPAARTLAKQDAGASCNVGEHAQHCSYQCDGR